MEEKIILPLTPEDFGTLESKIGIDQDKFCSRCDGPLETSNEGIFTAGIFYKCKHCGKKYKKTNYTDFRTKTDYFQLIEMDGAC